MWRCCLGSCGAALPAVLVKRHGLALKCSGQIRVKCRISVSRVDVGSNVTYDLQLKTLHRSLCVLCNNPPFFSDNNSLYTLVRLALALVAMKVSTTACLLAGFVSYTSARGTLSLSLSKRDVNGQASPQAKGVYKRQVSSASTVEESLFDILPWSTGGAYYTNGQYQSPLKPFVRHH